MCIRDSLNIVEQQVSHLARKVSLDENPLKPDLRKLTRERISRNLPTTHPEAICKVIQRKPGIASFLNSPDNRRNTMLRITIVDHLKIFIFLDCPAKILRHRM